MTTLELTEDDQRLIEIRVVEIGFSKNSKRFSIILSCYHVRKKILNNSK